MKAIFFIFPLQTKPDQEKLVVRLFVLFMILLITVPIFAGEIPSKPPAYIPNEILHDGSDVDGTLEPCPTKNNICVVDRKWSIQQIEAKLQGRQTLVWTEGEQMIFAAHVKADELIITYGVQEELSPVVDGSDYWVLTVWIRDLDQAVITHLFLARYGNQLYNLPDSYGVWRGENAPPEPESAFPLKGRLQDYDVKSKALNEMRAVSVYFPPEYAAGNRYPVIYMADGQSVGAFAQVLEPLILKGKIMPILLVGVHSAPYTRGRDLRLDEYILKMSSDPVRYHAHEHFFTETVRLWAETTLGAVDAPHYRAIMGYSNGAVFAAATAIRKPQLYGSVLVFSAGVAPDMRFDENIPARFYLTAGTLEYGFYSATSKLTNMLTAIGTTASFSPRVAGHDFIVWQEEFVNIVQQMF